MLARCCASIAMIWLLVGLSQTVYATLHAPETTVHYFRHIPFRETPYADLIGIYPITAEEAQQGNHFRFTYDTEGRPVRMERRNGDDFLVFSPDPNRYFLRATQTVITYTDNQEIRHFLNHWSDTVLVSGGVFREVYTYDDQGRRASLTFESPSGNPINNDWGIARYVWSHDAEGRVVEHRYDTEGTLVTMRPTLDFYEVRFMYDDRGFVTTMYNYGTEGVLTNNSTDTAIDVITYDEHGNFISWETFNKDGEPVLGNAPRIAKGTNTFDEQGYLIASTNYDLEGNVMMSTYGYASFRPLYDAWGNITGHKFYDTVGNLIVNAAGVAYSLNRFNHYGRLLETTLHDADDALTVFGSLGLAQIRYTYNSKQEHITTTFLDVAGNMVNHGGLGVALMIHTYDDNHRRIRSTFFDASGDRTAQRDTGAASVMYQYGVYGNETERHYFDVDGQRITPPTP